MKISNSKLWMQLCELSVFQDKENNKTLRPLGVKK